mmetsp:Transcript_46188/g.116920  ORF Transcript_46188/g.116920 Transcript_46188/m.116920 type:complete len:357 (-) Transcript_46188:1437-2507(-)
MVVTTRNGNWGPQPTINQSCDALRWHRQHYRMAMRGFPHYRRAEMHARLAPREPSRSVEPLLHALVGRQVHLQERAEHVHGGQHGLLRAPVYAVEAAQLGGAVGLGGRLPVHVVLVVPHGDAVHGGRRGPREHLRHHLVVQLREVHARQQVPVVVAGGLRLVAAQLAEHLGGEQHDGAAKHVAEEAHRGGGAQEYLEPLLHARRRGQSGRGGGGGDVALVELHKRRHRGGPRLLVHLEQRPHRERLQHAAAVHKQHEVAARQLQGGVPGLRQRGALRSPRELAAGAHKARRQLAAQRAVERGGRGGSGHQHQLLHPRAAPLLKHLLLVQHRPHRRLQRGAALPVHDDHRDHGGRVP